MKSIRNLTSLVAIATLVSLTMACGSDDDSPADDSSGSGGGAGSDGSGSGGSSGSAAPGSCDLSGDGLPREAIPLQITDDMTLTSDTVWTLDDIAYVNDGATLTIEPCTRIEGEKIPVGALVISRGGRIMAEGTADEPILFTGKSEVGSRMAGDWGGLILLGRAPNFEGDNVTIEGLEEAPENQYGGSDAGDNSGTLRYVRIEFSGFELSADNEINGLTLGSVGSGTTIDHIMVSNTLDDGYEWFGGTVNASHLISNNAGDDMFDMDQGYSGHLQFLFGRQVNPISSNPNGFECDSSNDGATPTTTPTVSNVTLCGLGSVAANGETIGAVFRERLEGNYSNLILTGFERGIDARDEFGSASSPNVEVTGSVFFDNFVDNIAPDETGDDDNDSGFDEVAWITDSARDNSESDPGFSCGPGGTPEPYPSSAIDGVTPGSGLDTSADYAGAFEDANDDWMTGLWVDWSES